MDTIIIQEKSAINQETNAGRARNGEAQTCERLPIETCESEYKGAYGKARVPRSVYEDWQAFSNLGINWELIRIAIEASEEAPRPSWAYARKILTNCVREGVYTAEQYEERQARWRSRKIAAAAGRHMITREYKEYEGESWEETAARIMSR